MEGLAKALALDVESVFDFTAELERLLNPDSNEDDRRGGSSLKAAKCCDPR